MKKRLLILLFVFVLAALTACGKKTEPADNGRDDVTQAVTPEAKEPTTAPADEPVDVPKDDPADVGGEDGADWRTWRSYTDDFAIGGGFSVCFSALDDGSGYAAYDSSNGDRVGTLTVDGVTGNDDIVAEDINGDGFADIGVTIGPETSWFAYVDKAWVDGVGGGCFEYVEPAEDPGEDDYPVMDALGNDPSVYDWNYENFKLRIVNAFDYDDHYLVMFDVLGRYAGDPEEIMGASVGDVLTLDGKPVTVTKILSMDSDYNYTVEHESYVEGCRVIVMPEDIHDFYTEEAIAESGMDENPENAEFGFVSFDEGETFDAYCDWAWDDCYVPLTCIVLSGVNFVVTDETLAYPAYYDPEIYGYDYAMPGCEYLKLREEGSYEERSDIKVYPDVCYQIELERDEAGYATGALSVLREIYTP